MEVIQIGSGAEENDEEESSEDEVEPTVKKPRPRRGGDMGGLTSDIWKVFHTNLTSNCSFLGPHLTSENLDIFLAQISNLTFAISATGVDIIPIVEFNHD